MNYYAITGLINVISSIAVGLFVYLNNRKEAANRVFALFTCTLSLWAFGYFMWQMSLDAASALFWCRVLMFGAIFVTPTLFHFIVTLVDERRITMMSVALMYLIFSVFALFDLTPLFVRDVVPKLFFPFWPEPGIAFHPFLIVWTAYLAYSFYILFIAIKKNTGVRKKQMTFVFLGLVITFLGGMMNYLLWYDIPIPPIGNILVPALLVFIGYAAVRYELFNIRIVAFEVFTFLISLSVLIGSVLAETQRDEIIFGSIFLIIIAFGIVLVRSVKSEAKQFARSKILSEQVEDKAAELYVKNSELNDKNNELNQKNDELGKRIGEIEKINKIMIDRELKMVELKQEIEELKKRGVTQ